MDSEDWKVAVEGSKRSAASWAAVLLTSAFALGGIVWCAALREAEEAVVGAGPCVVPGCSCRTAIRSTWCPTPAQREAAEAMLPPSAFGIADPPAPEATP